MMQGDRSIGESDNPLVGTWRLIRWYNVAEDGEEIFPLGDDASGYIMYSNDGFMSVILTAAGRPLFAVNDPFGGTLEEDSTAMKSHITYAGTYEYRGEDVVHHVTHSCCPNWVGSQQVRKIRFEGDKLELSAAGALLQGRPVTAYVLWERAPKS